MTTKWDPRIARQVRRDLGDVFDQAISQITLAVWIGYSRSAVQNWESGKATPEPAMRREYFRLKADPGHIFEIRMWEGIDADGKHEISETATG